MAATPQRPKRKKIKKKRIAFILILSAVVIFLAAGYFLNLLPDPGMLEHVLEPKVTATPPILLANGTAPLHTSMNIPLVADFSSAPKGHYSPLTLRFLDQSRGTPERWDWDFGDTTTSTLQHPVHEYSSAGVYNVSLTVTRGDGSRRSVTRYNILGTEQPPSKTVLVDTLREGYIGKGSEISFIPADGNSSVIIDGKPYPLPEGSRVKMRVGSDAAGRMNIRTGRVVSFAFSDVTLFVNGTQAASGEGGDCILPSYRYFQANLTYAVRPTNGEIRQIAVDGNKIRAGTENSQILITYHSGAIGEDLSLVTYPAYFEGRANSFTISDAVIASFEPGSGFTGPAPLSVWFRDTSAGSPDTWHWDFGDLTQSQDKNPEHIYSVPGSYTVTLTASRGNQKDTLIRKTAVIASPPRVVANFSASPQKGPAPLSVRCKDTSINAPSSWIWTFGPKSTPLTSNEQNPVVTYPHPGTYTVSLTSGNVYGSSDITRPEFITVTEPFRIPNKSILVKTGKRGYIEKDSVVEFVVLDRPASISINGGYRELGNGSVVRLDAMSDQEGEIFIDRGEIIKFSFPDIALYVNGELVSIGAIDSIFVPASSSFKTSLSYYLVPNSAYTLITVDGFNVVGDLDNAWIRVSSLGMNKDGSLRVTSSSNSTYIDGAMNQTVHDWVIE